MLRDAKLWCDTESSAEAAHLSAALGWTLVPSFTATKLLWLQRREPHVYSSAAHVMLPHDYVNYVLTGRMVMESGDASGTGLFDVVSRSWDQRAIDAVDASGRLRAMLPPLVGPDEAVGTLRWEVADELGLSPDVVVAPGSGDNACSALGAGVSRSGQMVISLGTSGTLFGKSATPILDASGAVCPFCDATGAWLPLVCTLNCTVPAQEVRELYGLDHAAITALAQEEPIGCDGVTYLPFLAGERTPNWPHATGSVLGLRPGSLARPGLLYRAAIEGATFSLLAGLRRMEALGLRPSELRAVGGGSRNPLWRQVIADAFQLPVRLPLEAESAAFGAALQAGAVHSKASVADFVSDHQPPLAEEVVLPRPGVRDAYRQAFERHVNMGQLLFGGGD